MPYPRLFRWLLPCLLLAVVPAAAEPPDRTFTVLAFATSKEDPAHLSFVQEAKAWFPRMAARHGFTFEVTDTWTRLLGLGHNPRQVVVFLDSRPEDPVQRAAFQAFMEAGGAWLGFHFAAFELPDSAVPANWPWYHETFLGSGAWAGNTWRPTSATLRLEAPDHPALQGLPATIQASPNEWYRWEHNLRHNPSIRVLASIHPSSFPLGTGPKPDEIWHSGDYPVVWTHTSYRMVYFNLGHNDMDYEGGTGKALSSTFGKPDQDRLILQALLWLGRGR